MKSTMLAAYLTALDTDQNVLDIVADAILDTWEREDAEREEMANDADRWDSQE